MLFFFFFIVCICMSVYWMDFASWMECWVISCLCPLIQSRLWYVPYRNFGNMFMSRKRWIMRIRLLNKYVGIKAWKISFYDQNINAIICGGWNDLATDNRSKKNWPKIKKKPLIYQQNFNKKSGMRAILAWVKDGLKKLPKKSPLFWKVFFLNIYIYIYIF